MAKVKAKNRGAVSRSGPIFRFPAYSEAPVWPGVWWVLLAAFVWRALIALTTDFIIHPDEIMQYLETAHGAVFGNNLLYMEYYYGQRSWLMPGFVAGILWLCDAVGLGIPEFYVPAVKLVFCAISLFIVYGLYVVARRLFNENAARIAVVFGAFWYELAGFAHKPMTEFVATALLFASFIVLFRREKPSNARLMAATALAVLLVAIRIQYAPLAAVALLPDFIRSDWRARLMMAGVGAVGLAVVGLFEYVTWGGYPFNSYWVGLNINIHWNTLRAGESSPFKLIVALIVGSGGIFLAAFVAGVVRFRRSFFILGLILAVLLPHMLSANREYRYVFAIVPLWILLFADLLATGMSARHSFPELLARMGRPLAGVAYAAVVSLMGVFNAIPQQYQAHVWRHFDGTFDAYRYLRKDDGVTGILEGTRELGTTPGYYYLHKKVPLYDNVTAWRLFGADRLSEHVSHVITYFPVTVSKVSRSRGQYVVHTDGGDIPAPIILSDRERDKLVFWDERGQPTVVEDFEKVHVIEKDGMTLWRSKRERPARQWKRYVITPSLDEGYDLMRGAFGEGVRKPPENFGIEFAE